MQRIGFIVFPDFEVLSLDTATVFEVANMVAQEQLYDLHFFHCIGMTPAGYPNADPRKAPINDVLRENQVFAVECYMGERGSPLAVKLEEMILVTKGEPERLAPKLTYDERLLN